MSRETLGFALGAGYVTALAGAAIFATRSIVEGAHWFDVVAIAVCSAIAGALITRKD